ncbi:MAG: hypothetical protein IJN99_00075 [Clostridia bacterium]|nr:hypothetical protein [Clostridia bacterium]
MKFDFTTLFCAIKEFLCKEKLGNLLTFCDNYARIIVVFEREGILMFDTAKIIALIRLDIFPKKEPQTIQETAQ